MTTTEKFDLQEVLTWLKSIDYRVTHPFSPREFYSESPPSGKLLKAAILDTETTGTNQFNDKIIELGIVVIEYSPDTGQVYKVLETFDELEDPGIPIPIESTKIHGITDEMVRGRKLNDIAVEQLLADVSIVIAHNASFDRGFIENRFPFFSNKPWACSLKQIPWKSEGFGSASLEFLAYRFNFHFSGHRASIDCHALLEVLQSDFPETGLKVMKTLLENARIPEIKIWALNAPFEKKDNLKERGYRWDGDRKVWNSSIQQIDLQSEINWLRDHIYSNKKFKLELEKIDALNRFTSRKGISEIIDYSSS